MKKLIFTISAFMLIGSMSSCVKSYTCQCVRTSSPLSSFVESESTTLKSPLKKDAEDKCDKIEEGGHWTECRLD